MESQCLQKIGDECEINGIILDAVIQRLGFFDSDPVGPTSGETTVTFAFFAPFYLSLYVLLSKTLVLAVASVSHPRFLALFGISFICH